jgi:expansin (peptidoglycan-binding protein)
MGRFKKINTNIPTGLSGSKVSLNPVNPDMEITANKNAASIDVEGNAEKGDGVVYMTHTITKTTISKSTEDVLESVGVTTNRTKLLCFQM